MPAKKSKPKKPVKKATKAKAMPHLGVAVLCENVLHEGNVATLVRIIDTMNVGTDSPDFVPGIIRLHLYLLFKSGDAKGKYDLDVRLCRPDHETEPLKIDSKTLEFKGGEHGSALDLTLTLAIKMAGLHWLDVLVNKSLVTRVPLKIVYRQRTNQT